MHKSLETMYPKFKNFTQIENVATVVENSGNQLNTNQSHNFGSFAFTRDLCFGTAD
jgi:hypothetical protein